MGYRRTLCKGLSAALVIALGYVMNSPADAAQEVWRFDCGTADSPVMAGFQPLTADDAYSPAKGFGWEGVKPQSIEFQNPGPLRPHTRPREVDFDENLTDLNRDAVKSTEDLILRVDVPNGRYRVRLLFGDMTQAVSSVDVHVNGKLAATRATAWTLGGYRSFIREPYGWWAPIRHTAVVDDGMIRIRLSKNQSYYDEQMAEQSPWESPFKIWWPAANPPPPPPYFYIGYPFIHNSLMAVEIAPLVRPPVIGQDGRLKLIAEIDSPALRGAISSFNIGDLDAAAASLARVTEPDAQVAKAVVALWLAGHPDVEMEKTLVPGAIEILRQHVRVHPEETVLAEHLQDAEYFQKALTTHLTRGHLADDKGRGKNHFIENDRAIGWWWLIGEDSPLYYTSQLYIARAGHMLRPYMPTLGTEAEILKKLEKKFPNNRYVRYLLHWEWEPVGDGSRFEDWYMVGYSSKAKDSPDWVREQYPALASLVDWAEWFFKFKQRPEGTIGGGWGDDVEIVGAFGYTGYVGRGVSDLAIQGAGKLVDGVWNLSEVDPELGFCLALADAEHTAEWTGNTLGMMVVIDYGNPVWLERSMKTGKLLRDLWTDYDMNGHRHFRANFFSAAQVGADDQANDSWINYRAIAPASAVLWYNQSPAISKVLVELADAWRAAAMSTARGKPRGIIPAEVSFPQGIIGGMNSPNWYTASHPPGTVKNKVPTASFRGGGRR